MKNLEIENHIFHKMRVKIDLRLESEIEVE
jgi:hypothetical protein